jgi:DNA-binding NarL/FixJ family response regulator
MYHTRWYTEGQKTYLKVIAVTDEWMHKGLSNEQIAARFIISHFTVGKHVQQILRKFGAANRTQAASIHLI